jgi:hypothetical protein
MLGLALILAISQENGSETTTKDTIDLRKFVIKQSLALSPVTWSKTQSI